MTKSKVIRYKVEEINCSFDAEMVRDLEGEYVRYDNYVLLEATKMIWQPIATAPKDGTLILGFFDGTICTIEWFIYDDGRGLWETFYGESEVVPTHWMPLPAPPNQNPTVPPEGEYVRYSLQTLFDQHDDELAITTKTNVSLRALVTRLEGNLQSEIKKLTEASRLMDVVSDEWDRIEKGDSGGCDIASAVYSWKIFKRDTK